MSLYSCAMPPSHFAKPGFCWLLQGNITRITAKASSHSFQLKHLFNTSAVSSAQPRLPKIPLKPSTPYRKDLCLDIQRIEPPHPFSFLYRDYTPKYLKKFLRKERGLREENELETVEEVDECLSRKPLPCTILEETAKLRIIKELAVQNSHGAQAFTCIVSPRLQGTTHAPPTTYPPDTLLVAKVYDPLYYPFHDREPPHGTLDILRYAEARFTDETAAYTYLNPSLGGSIVPRYYGAWTFTMSLRGVQRRVHMILIEHVAGTPLSKLNHKKLTKEERLNVVAKVMEAKAELFYVGVRNDDLAPRNLIAETGRGCSLGDPNLQVRAIDFDRAVVEPLRGLKPRCMSQEKPDSPVWLFDDDCPSGFADWVWVELKERGYYVSPGWEDWVKERWRDDKRYMPVPDE